MTRVPAVSLIDHHSHRLAGPIYSIQHRDSSLELPFCRHLEPAYVPGTGTPEPGGLTPREAFPIVRRICAESNVVGFELVELAPMLDPTYVSALNANRLIRECMTGVAMRKQGLTDPHYLSPLTSSHGQN